MKSLEIILNNIVIEEVLGPSTVSITALCIDAREAIPDSLFIALRGYQTDGHQYIMAAITKGSVAIICEKLPISLSQHVTYIRVTHTKQVLGLIAHNFYDQPSTKLQLVATTGTSGKTSTTHLLYGLFRQLGYKVGMLSTIYHAIHDTIIPSALTTPHALEIHDLLAKMVEAGCQYCFMEASSHAIVQHRMAGLQLAGAIFLNISHDHLDYHHTFGAYIKAKKALFDHLPQGSFALYNADDKRGSIMMQNTRATIQSFALQLPADFTTQVISNTWQGIELRIQGKNVWVQLLGIFNAYNILAAYATAILLKQPSQEILIALSALKPIVGRFQHIATARNITILVDYAHKPDALEKVLLAIQHIRKTSPTPGRIITVVGCGGNRDIQKRPLMAQVGYTLSDQLILTSDNPRYEDPLAIIEDMKKGLKPAEQLKTLSIADRVEAIKTSLQLAKANDILLIAGKGHETYQEIAGIKYPLSDAEIVQNILNLSV